MNKLFKFFMFLSIPLLSVLAVSCDDDEVVDEVSGPSITSVSPEEGLPGASVTISGTNLDDATVTFGSAAASVTANTSTSITTTVPETAAAGNQTITVTTAAGSDTHSFTVQEEEVDPTTITSFDPAEGAVGEEITITGTNFDEANIIAIFMGEVEVTEYTVVDENTITFTVPEGAETGTVSITLAQGDPVVSSTEFVISGAGGNEANLHRGIIIHAQGDRMEEDIHTVFNMVEGTTHFYEDPVENEELARSVDFILADTDGANNYAIMEPNPQGDASWLLNNFYKEVEWPHTNSTMLRVLDDADEAYFEAADAEVIQALSIGENEDDHSGRIDPIAVGDVILFQSDAGRKGLIYFRSVAQDTEEDYKNDVFTVDVKVLDISEDGDSEE